MVVTTTRKLMKLNPFGMNKLVCVSVLVFLALISCHKEDENIPHPVINLVIKNGRVDTTQFVHSSILKQNIHYSVYLPPSYDTSKVEYPVLYLFHGMGGNHRDWVKKGMAEMVDVAISDRSIKEMIVIMPDGRSGFYCNNYHGLDFRYEDFMIQEFMPFVENKYRITSTQKGRAVSGLSMGGYGTALYAFKHPELFCAAFAMSAVFELGNTAPDLKMIIEDKLKSNATFPAFTMECGTEDFLYSSNQTFDLFLSSKNISHLYTTRPGAHDWNFWKVCLPKALKLASDNFQ